MEKTIAVMECLMPELMTGLGRLWTSTRVVKIHDVVFWLFCIFIVLLLWFWVSIIVCAIIYVFISTYQRPLSCSNFCINSQEPSLLLSIQEFSPYHQGSRKWGSYEPSCCGEGSSNRAGGGIINWVSTLQLYQVYLSEFCHTSKKQEWLLFIENSFKISSF